MAAAIAILPIWIIYFYCKNFDKLGDAEFEHKYGASYEGMRTDSRAILAYPIIFMIRRFALVLVITVAREQLWA